ncbi:TerC family protein [Neobacillus mesonae]|uniref:TerC family protein n=1 Tax=Neobacillus mesonae TaxID=1193713 RepID=UPI002573866A|nr:hypothetical protein [Neobacillus mesonae]MED4206447.1 hypothetical protein [Neobacillus mesonae]
MHEIIKVFFINLISDIDNMLILGTVLRRYSHLNITFLAVIVLTITRTFYVLVVEGLSQLPMFHLLVGTILLIIAFKLVTRSIIGEEQIRMPNLILLKLKVILLLAATDFLICLDSIIVIYEFSTHILPVIIGIFCSLFISLHFLPMIEKLAVNFYWINIIAGGFIAHNSVMVMMNEPRLERWFLYLHQLYPNGDIVNIAADGAVIIVVITGLISYLNHRRITIR